MKKKISNSNLNGFSYLELLVVISILTIIFATSFTIRGAIFPDTNLSIKTSEITDNIRLAQIRAIARYKDSQWGVYFNHVAGGSDSYTIFKGSSYSGRDSSYDMNFPLPNVLSFTTININGGGSEVVFSKTNGTTTQYGSVILRSTENKTATITVNTKGVVDIQ